MVYTVAMDYTPWAKKNKKQLVEKIVGNFKAEPVDNPLAVFAAGIPGAGKTEFLDRLFANSPDFIRIDLDEIVKQFEGYTPENYYLYRGAANIILEEVFTYCRHHKLNFVLDGTFGHKQAIGNIEKALKRHVVVIFYVWQDPVLAWQLTKDREVVTKRAIERDGFIQSCLNVPNNLQTARKKFGDKISIIVIQKNQNHNFDVVRDPSEIDEILSKTYTKNRLGKLII